MDKITLQSENNTYYQVETNEQRARKLSIENGAELAHAGKSPNDALVLLKEILEYTSTSQGTHFTIQICSKTSSNASCRMETTLSFISSIIIGVIKVQNPSLLSNFTYTDIFMNNPYAAGNSSGNQVLCSIESTGHFFEIMSGQINHSDTFRFFDNDIITLIATYTEHDLFFSFAKNGNIVPSSWRFCLNSAAGGGSVAPFFFIQLRNINLKIIGDITDTKSYLPNPKTTYSLLSYKLQMELLSSLAPCLMTMNVSKKKVINNEPPGLHVYKLPSAAETSTVQPTMAFSETPHQSPQMQTTAYPLNTTTINNATDIVSIKPDPSNKGSITSKVPVSEEKSVSDTLSSIELSNIQGFGKQMGNHTVYADYSTIFAEIDLGTIKILSNQKSIQHYSFSTEAVKPVTDMQGISQFSLGVFPVTKGNSSSSTSSSITSHISEAVMPDIRLLCIHKDVLKELPSCALFPLLLSSKLIEPDIPCFNAPGIYDFVIRDDGIEVQTTDSNTIRIDKFMITSINALSHVFNADFYAKMTSLEKKLFNGQGDSSLTISSYTICISVNSAYVSVFHHNDKRLKAIRASNGSQIKSLYTLTQLSTKTAWEQMAEQVYKQLNNNSASSSEFRFLRNTLGFIGFIDTSYRIATIDTEGVAVTTPIPLLDPKTHTHGDILSICGLSIPKGCRLQLVSYDISKDRRLEGHSNIAQEYFLNPPGKSSYLDSSVFNRGLYQNESIKTYEFLYEAIFSRETNAHKTNKKGKSMSDALESVLKKFLASNNHENLLPTALNHLQQPNYLYDVFISRELDRVQSPVRSSVIRHMCAYHADAENVDITTPRSKESIELWNRLESTVVAGMPFWIFFNSIINLLKQKPEHTSDFMMTNTASCFNGRDFSIIAHKINDRVLYVLYSDGKPVQTVLTTKPIHVMMVFESPWAMTSKHNLCKSPSYVPNYLRLTSWIECFQRFIPFSPYLPSYLEMIPLTSSLNLEMDSSTVSSNNANSLSLYNNAANKMSHWESLLFVGSNSLVSPQTTNLYMSIYSPYNSNDTDLSILHRSLFRQYGSKSPRGSYEEGNYVSLVASQYRQTVSNHAGNHKFKNSDAHRLDINDTITNIGRKISNPPPTDHVIDNISMYRYGKLAKADFLTNITNTYYGNSYKFNGTENPLLQDKSIKLLKEKIANFNSYKFSWHELRQTLDVIYYEPILLFLCMGHCVDYTHMFNTEELFYGENDLDTIVLNLLLLIFGGGNVSNPCTPIVDLLIAEINRKGKEINSKHENIPFISGNIGPVARVEHPKHMLDISFPPNILRDEYRSFYNYDKLCYVYASNAFETYHFGENSKGIAVGQQEARTTGSVSLAPTCNPPASVYVRFEYIYVPKVSKGTVDDILLHEGERVNKVIDDLIHVEGRENAVDDPVFPQFELVNTQTSQQLYAFSQKSSSVLSSPNSIVKNNNSIVQFTNYQSPTSPYTIGNREDDKTYTVSNCGYTVDATNLNICVLLSEMLPNRPLYCHCLKIVVRFRGEYGRFMIDRYSSTFSCARFTGDDRTKKKYMELKGDMRITIILDYKQMFIFMFAHDLASSNQANAQRVPWKINWPVRFMILLQHASAEITTLEN